MSESTTIRPDTSDMAAVHKVFRTSLAAGPDFLSSAAGDDERRALIANYYANLMAFLKVHHEGEEELVFPLLIERAPQHAGLVTQAEGQHADVIGRLLAVSESVNSWDLKGDPQAPDLLNALRSLETSLMPHLDQEEAEIVPLAAEHLTPEEWGALPGHAMRSFDGDKIWLIIGLIRENFTPQQREAMLANMPPPARDMWQGFGESAFNDLIAEVRQTG
ncbi:hemerythrin domain-containing protein [Mycobacterium sp.]|uniref:hemerythrin domain-containing protein n=1 Tax=Mycobacterium sp. TaxID=1785 RepID=UPI003BB1FE69